MLSYWEYVFLLANIQFSYLRKAEGMVRHFLINVSCCPTTPVFDIWSGVLKKCCSSQCGGEPQQQKRKGPMESQEVGCRVSGLRGSMEHLVEWKKGRLQMAEYIFVDFLWGVWCAGEG